MTLFGCPVTAIAGDLRLRQRQVYDRLGSVYVRASPASSVVVPPRGGLTMRVHLMLPLRLVLQGLYRRTDSPESAPISQHPLWWHGER
jgi:hypothetical protein